MVIRQRSNQQNLPNKIYGLGLNTEKGNQAVIFIENLDILNFHKSCGGIVQRNCI
jgi:hypothetical protein